MRSRSRLVWLPLATSVLMLTGRASAQWWWPPTEFAVDVDCGSGATAVTLGGDWPSSCIPNGSGVSIAGSRIDVLIHTEYSPGTGCLAVIVPWSRRTPLPLLAHGTYTVYARWLDNGSLTAGPTEVGSFLFDCACPADLDNGSGSGTPDEAVNIDDLIYFLVKFEAGDVRVDLDDGSGTGTPDNAVTVDDLLFFLARFEGGC